MTILKQGDKAPDFSVTDQKGQTRTLSEFLGRKLALYFYPKDKTPGCTAEACNLSENSSVLEKEGITIVGVSTDSEKSHKGFADKYRLPFPLLADVNKKMVNDYGVWGEKKFMGKRFMGTNRVTFLINEKGIIDHIITKVKTKDHTRQILETWVKG